MKIFGFTKQEATVVGLILLTIGVVVSFNLQISERKSRDAQRKSDIRAIYDALMSYQNDFGFFPLDENGKIAACKGESGENGIPKFTACNWYQDSLKDIFDDSYTPYLRTIPGDPQTGKGAQYLYLSNGKRFQLFAALESSSEDEYNPEVVARNLNCGNRICNFALASGQTPVNITIDEYERQLLELEIDR